MTVFLQIAYSILVIPVSLARLIQFSGHEVPFWATILADTIFNLQGELSCIFVPWLPNNPCVTRDRITQI